MATYLPLWLYVVAKHAARPLAKLTTKGILIRSHLEPCPVPFFIFTQLSSRSNTYPHVAHPKTYCLYEEIGNIKKRRIRELVYWREDRVDAEAMRKLPGKPSGKDNSYKKQGKRQRYNRGVSQRNATLSRNR